jgi:hypothetical protein
MLGYALAAGSAFTGSAFPVATRVRGAGWGTGSTTNTLSSRDTGDTIMSYHVTIDEANPELSVWIFNLAPGKGD